MTKRWIAAVTALLLMGSSVAVAEGTVEKQEDFASNGIIVMHNRQIKETEKQKLAMDFPTFEGENTALAAYLTNVITTPFLALAKTGQMAEDTAYLDGSKDFIRSGYYASLDFEGILSMEMTVSNRAAGEKTQEILFVYHIIDLDGPRELTIYDLFSQEPAAVDAAIRREAWKSAQSQGDVVAHVTQESQVPMPDSYFLTKDYFRCIFGAGAIRKSATLVDIPWEELGLTLSPLLNAAAPGAVNQSVQGAPPEINEEGEGVWQDAAEEPFVPAFQDAEISLDANFMLPPVQTPTPMPVTGTDVDVADLLTRGLWKQMGTEGETYYQFTPDGKLLVVNVEDYSLREGTLESQSLSGQVVLGGDTAFTLETESGPVGYVLNRAGVPVAPEELVTPSPTPVPTPTPEPTATPTPTPTPTPVPTLSPYELAREQTPRLAVLEDASFDRRQSLKVYGAPSLDAYRETPWRVDTDESVGIYGVDNDWVLVSYEISSGKRGRIGYIENTTLANPDQVAMLRLGDMELPLLRDAAATDDPLWSKGKVTTLKKDTMVKLLAFLDSEWAYVETTTEGKARRLFIPQNSLIAE